MITNIIIKNYKNYTLYYYSKYKLNKKYKKLIKYNKYNKLYNPRQEINIFNKIFIKNKKLYKIT